MPRRQEVIELAKKAKQKNLNFMSGFVGGIITPNRKYSKESSGEIGDANAMYSTYNGGEVWKKAREDGWGDLGRTRNWNAHLWLSGTHSGASRSLYRHDAMGHGRGIAYPCRRFRRKAVYDDMDKYGT